MSKHLFNIPHLLTKPIIRVLIYTDDPHRIREDGVFGIQELRRQLAAHPLAFAEIDLRPIISRNSDATHHADHKIDDELNKDAHKPYHEIWFFGIHQANKPKYKLDFPGGGGPHSELEPDEVAALNDWMTTNPNDGSKGLGVLMCGDHANPPPDKQPISGPDKFCPPSLDHRRFLGLGRAIGKRVPRAGLLRKWEGPPTHCCEDSFNTLVPPPSEVDPVPQRLVLPRFDQHGNPDPCGKPHEIFRGRNGELIQVLPDHEHEGAVVLPDDFPQKIWPHGPQFRPLPRNIAYGTDRRTGRRLNILAAYNGDAAMRGRIISDSSWHHYLNVNLESFSADHLDLPAADQIGQFYSNLVVWLAPLSTRKAMAKAMFIWLATHPAMVEEIGAGVLNIGSLALKLLRQIASDCEIHELLVAACPEPLRLNFERLNFPHEPEVSELPTVEVLLGSVVSKHFEEASWRENSYIGDEQLATIIHDGFTQAFLINAISTARFSYQSLAVLFSFASESIPHAAIETFQSLQSLQLISQSERKITMRTLPTDYFLDMTLDRGGVERFNLHLDQDPSQCVPGPLGLPVCRLSGWLNSSQNPVTGTLLGDDVIHLRFPLRRVEIIMGGIVLPTDDLVMRFSAVPPFINARRPDILSIDPDVGDTGTGTATQTVVVEKASKE